jgi:transcriptional regulator with XRE-family HTH domain
MRTYEFSIIASGLDPQAENFESRFYDCGCDDALVSFQKGHIILDFAREAESIDAAIASAVEDVIAAGAVVDRIEPDPLVSLSDISARTGLTRSAISQYAKGQRQREFPAPVARVTSESPLWSWPVVACWLFEHHKVTRDVVIEAEVVREANRAIEDREWHMHARLRQQAEKWEAAL